MNGKSVRSAWRLDKSRAGRWSTISMPICVNRSFGFRAGTIWSRRSITFSSVGRPSHSFWTMAVFAFPTMPPSAA